MMKSLGMMSGTSVDGSVSAAIIETDGEDVVTRIATCESRYESEDGLRPIHHLIKAAELAYRKAGGDHQKATNFYQGALRDYLKEVAGVRDSAVESTLDEIVRSFSPKSSSVSLADVIRRSTQVHLSAARAILTETGISQKDIRYIGYHGQTVYHDPFFNRVTVQVGDPKLLADELGIPVVFDFRSNDVALGGQGAPLAPAYHRALLCTAGISQAAILNLGGTANLTVTSSGSDEMLGFDTGPANGLIDRYVKEKLGLALDRDSHLAQRGKVSEIALKRLLSDAIKLKDGRSFLEIKPPKSLDIRDYTYAFPEFQALSVEDGCATLNAFTAECVACGVDWIQRLGLKVPTQWFTCGGGVFSPHLRQQIVERLTARIPGGITLKSADSVGWSAQAMEAELFAYLAVRSIKGLPITFPGTTGVGHPATGGRVVNPT